ncbi:MAG TPA: hypothetical protein VEL31_09990 [Ktedonobacteraceae bacterium]|nr:hypothetical protein [Ktedonobacteraceae bacterium]
MNSVRGRGVRNGSAASGQRESQEGRSHARSTSQSTLVAHPVGIMGNRLSSARSSRRSAGDLRSGREKRPLAEW